jgi:hypothetical protein
VCIRKKEKKKRKVYLPWPLDKWHGKRRPEDTLRGQLSRSLTTRHSLCAWVPRCV